ALPAEIQASLKTIHEIDADHKKLVAELDKAEADWSPKAERMEKERAGALSKATAALAAYEKEVGPGLAELAKQRQAKIEQATAALKLYETEILTTKLPEFAKGHKAAGVDWVRLNPRSLKATGKTQLIKQDDLSIVAAGPLGKTTYTVTAGTDLKGITAVRLELLADEKLPGNGPGRAPNGNLVVSKFKLTVAPKSDPSAAKPATFAKATADFSQDQFPVASAVEPPLTGGMGWAVVPNTGVTHWAVFELKEPISVDGGAVLTFTLSQQYPNGDHQIGRFRISVAAAKPPVALGLPDDLQIGLETPAVNRTPRQQDALARYVAATDPGLKAKQATLAEAQKPLAADPRLADLKAAVTEAQKPVLVDPKLLQLRQDVATSAKQLGNPRLTGAQDVVWALVNSPAFLFNH
ncbi:MAG TPA: hypothetical protein VH120_02955, partial [Gemmataceae bacterium]|nr:hypothetical protein [Gemmataceae bacterium]